MNENRTKNTEWKYFEYKDIFEIKKGKRLTIPEQERGKIPYISSSSLNNGIDNYIANGYTDKNCLSFACYGSIGCVFYHPYKVWVSDNCNVMYLKNKKLSENIAFFLKTLLELEKYRFSYGVTAKLGRLKKFKIKLPSKNNLVDWSFIEKYIERIKIDITYPISDSVLKAKIELKTDKWKNFLIQDLFWITKGERLTKPDRLLGKVPFVAASNKNNGVVHFIDQDFHSNKRLNQNKITIDMFFHAFYQRGKFFSDDNVHTLSFKNSENDNPYTCIFITTVLNFNQYKYAYGRQTRLNRLRKESIKLPVDKNRKPDWTHIEKYVKSLPYSSNV